MTIFAFGTASVLVALSYVVYTLVLRYWWTPTQLARLLRSRGFAVLPYTLFVGRSLEISHVQHNAYSSPLSCGPSDHRYLSRIWAFHFAKCAFSSAGKSAVYWLGYRPSLNIVSAEEARDILSSYAKEFVKFPTAYVTTKRVFGRSLLTVEGNDWEHRRRILDPAFSSERLKAMGAQMSACVNEMIASWEHHAQQNSTAEFELDAFEEFRKVSVDVLSRTSFGSNYKEGKVIFEHQQKISEATYRDAARYVIFPGYRFLPTARNRLCWRLQRHIEKTLHIIVENRVSAVHSHQSDTYGEDLLGRIISTNSSSLVCGSVLTTQDIIDRWRTFFFAGHESTADLLTWAMMLMAVFHDWQERARAEVLEICGSKGIVNAHSKLKVLEMILLETLRLYPPVAQLISRTRVKDREPGSTEEAMCKITNVPPGVQLTILPGVFHRDTNLWGDDADVFRPERFADGISHACKGMHSFMPFGFGPHTCIGQTFAMLEAKLVLASILQRFRFRLSDKYRHAPQLYVTLRPQYGMPLMLTPISSA